MQGREMKSSLQENLRLNFIRGLRKFKLFLKKYPHYEILVSIHIETFYNGMVP